MVPKVHEIIIALYVYGYIVNNVCGDGATEIRSTFEKLATLTVGDVFLRSECNCASTSHATMQSSLLDNLPNIKLLIAF